MDQKTKGDKFRSLHTGSEILVLPNAWDVISARIVEAEGFPAGATSSAAVASMLGYQDGQHISRAEMLGIVARITAATRVPVTVDVEAGYGDAAATALDVVGAGAVGMNLEDMVRNVLTPLSQQLEMIRAVRKAVDASGVPFVLNARTDIFLAKDGDEATRVDRAVERLNAFRDAGADCLFAPGVADAETIGRIASAVKGPLNILATVGTPSIAELKRLRVKRVSLGSGTSRVALGALQRFVRQLKTDGMFTAFQSDALPFPEVQKLLSRS
jgi:2-methylisocitrate lyase-like PEP mutase family enzyme